MHCVGVLANMLAFPIHILLLIASVSDVSLKHKGMPASSKYLVMNVVIKITTGTFN